MRPRPTSVSRTLKQAPSGRATAPAM
ncbi:hypothetical protein LEMLEM_LOCUS26596 [Lemmus lemmus]